MIGIPLCLGALMTIHFVMTIESLICAAVALNFILPKPALFTFLLKLLLAIRCMYTFGGTLALEKHNMFLLE